MQNKIGKPEDFVPSCLMGCGAFVILAALGVGLALLVAWAIRI